MKEGTPTIDERMMPIDVQALRQQLLRTPLAHHVDALIQATEQSMASRLQGRMPEWTTALSTLPQPNSLSDLVVKLDADTITASFTPDQSTGGSAGLKEALKAFSPWRKGPYQIGDVTIDTEWRSDWKWHRIADALSPLDSRTVLDVGCGNGYHLWRLHAAGASTVLGIDPSPLFLMQFKVLQRYVQQPAVMLLPLALEELLANDAFDTVLSMGVLSHRRDPLEHLQQLRTCLRSDGQLLLETLVLPGDDDQLLTLNGRYARMRNVWQLPTLTRLKQWLAQSGFHSVQLVHVADTTIEEQRTTEWMPFESLVEAIDTDNPSVTVEGHPRPRRAVVLAQL